MIFYAFAAPFGDSVMRWTCTGLIRSSADLIGFEVTDAVSRKFKSEIAAGRILVVVDASKEQLVSATTAITRTGAASLPFHAHTVLTWEVVNFSTAKAGRESGVPVHDSRERVRACTGLAIEEKTAGK